MERGEKRRKEGEESEREGKEVALGVARCVEEGAERGCVEGCEALGGGESRLRLRRVLLEDLVDDLFFVLSLSMKCSRLELPWQFLLQTILHDWLLDIARRATHRASDPFVASHQRRTARSTSISRTARWLRT